MVSRLGSEPYTLPSCTKGTREPSVGSPRGSPGATLSGRGQAGVQGETHPSAGAGWWPPGHLGAAGRAALTEGDSSRCPGRGHTSHTAGPLGSHLPPGGRVRTVRQGRPQPACAPLAATAAPLLRARAPHVNEGPPASSLARAWCPPMPPPGPGIHVEGLWSPPAPHAGTSGPDFAPSHHPREQLPLSRSLRPTRKEPPGPASSTKLA